MQHFFRYQTGTGHALHSLLSRTVVIHQFGKGLVRDGRRIFCRMQAGLLQSTVGQIAFHRFFVLDVLLLLTAFDLIQRWLSNVDVTTLDDFRHLTEEEGQQQCTDVRAIDVGIGHDDDTVVTQLIRVEFFAANTAAQSRDQGADLSG